MHLRSGKIVVGNAGKTQYVKQYLLRLLTDFTVIGTGKARKAMRFRERDAKEPGCSEMDI
ncbi:MAG: hypothetical protein AB8B87_02125 [Granulosicoccus sp.]